MSNLMQKEIKENKDNHKDKDLLKAINEAFEALSEAEKSKVESYPDCLSCLDGEDLIDVGGHCPCCGRET